MVEAAERGYRWGRFQGWATVALGVAEYLFAFWPSDGSVRFILYATGALHMVVGAGLLGKKRYGFVLLYLLAAISTLHGLTGGPSYLFDVIVKWSYAFWWTIPALFYYPKRYREFGFGKQKQDEKAAVRLTEPESAVAAAIPLKDVEVQQVLEEIQKRREKRNAGF
jgi:hypothetical protein